MPISKFKKNAPILDLQELFNTINISKEMSLEQLINYQLNKIPCLKKGVKRLYQLSMYSISHKIRSEGNIIKVSPNDNKEYFFGYYDKSPWDSSGRYMLCMKADDTWTDPDPKTSVEILLIDLENPENTRVLATSRTWNVQQGCMAQWLGPDFSEYIIYNDLRNNKYCSVILNVNTGKEEQVIDCPVYSVSNDGETALSLDFSRLHNLRKGYGYSAVPEKTEGIDIPDATAVWRIDIESGNVESILKYSDFANFRPRKEMIGATHKVNHLMISPNGKRFMVLHRWFQGYRKYTRLVTCDIDGNNMYNLSDDDMVSHCYWKNDSEILAFENKHEIGPGYYLMKDKTQEYRHLWPSMSADGHPSYSPDGTLIVTDTYPNKARIAEVKVMKENEIKVIAKVFAPFRYDNDTRCDLHPRWDRKGENICIDAVFEGKRGLYVIKLDNNE